MSERPEHLKDLELPDAPTQHRVQAWSKADGGTLCWSVRGEVWQLPETAPDEADIEICRALDEPGRQARFQTRTVLRPRALEGTKQAPLAEVRRRWETGTLLLSPATRYAVVPDGVGGEMVSPRVRTLALRTPTLPPATHTNCHIVGTRRALIVDPASPDRAEQERLELTLDRHVGLHGPPEAIFLTHHHSDHVGGVQSLRNAMGLPVWAHARTADRVPFDVDRLIGDGDKLGGFEALFTPGHAPGHLCLWDPEHRLLVAGDMVAAVGTIVIEPSEGDMGEYIRQLERLRALEPRVIFPAHGGPVLDADAHLAKYLRHRLWREERIYAALNSSPASLSQVTQRAYTDVSSQVLWLAERSALAHLIKLRDEGRAYEDPGGWRR